MDVSVGSDGMHGKAEFPAPRQPACGWRYVPRNSLALEHTPIVPMADQHVTNAQLAESFHLTRTIRVVDDPVGLGVRESIVVKNRDMLDAHKNRATSCILITGKMRHPIQHAL